MTYIAVSIMREFSEVSAGRDGPLRDPNKLSGLCQACQHPAGPAAPSLAFHGRKTI